MNASDIDSLPSADLSAFSELPHAAQLFNQGNVHFRAGSWAEAKTCNAQALAADPQLEAAPLQWARSVVRLGDGMAARQAFSHLLKAFLSNYSGWLEAGHLCRQQGVPEQAVMSYQRAVQAAPTRFEARLALARVLEDQGQMELGAAHYHQALAAAEAAKNRMVHRQMAKYRLQRSDAPRALEAMRQALLVMRLCCKKFRIHVCCSKLRASRTQGPSNHLSSGLQPKALRVGARSFAALWARATVWPSTPMWTRARSHALQRGHHHFASPVDGRACRCKGGG